MPTAVFHVDRVAGGDRIEVGPGEEAALGGLGVIVLEPQHPLACLSGGGPLPERSLNGADRAEVTVHLAQMPNPGV